MKALLLNWRTVFAFVILFIWGIAIAFAQDDDLSPIHLSEGIWLALVAGIIQGLIWYGAVNSKLTALTSRMNSLEVERGADNMRFEARYESLLKIFINTLKVKP